MIRFLQIVVTALEAVGGGMWPEKTKDARGDGATAHSASERASHDVFRRILSRALCSVACYHGFEMRPTWPRPHHTHEHVITATDYDTLTKDQRIRASSREG